MIGPVAAPNGVCAATFRSREQSHFGSYCHEVCLRFRHANRMTVTGVGPAKPQLRSVTFANGALFFSSCLPPTEADPRAPPRPGWSGMTL